jgi:hypothetical protein
LVSIGSRGPQEPGGHPKIEEKYQKKQEAKGHQNNIAVGQAPDEIVEVAQGIKPPQINHEVLEDQGEDEKAQQETNCSKEQNFEPTPETGHHLSFLSATGVENFITGIWMRFLAYHQPAFLSCPQKRPSHLWRNFSFPEARSFLF